MNPKSIKYLVASLLLACTGIVHAEPAGNVIRLVGTVSAVSADNVSRALTAGDVINVGDTIKTGEKSAIQIQMKDAALVAVTANAALKIETYTYQKGPQKSGAAATPDKIVMALQKGRFRTITGNAKRTGYTMKSPIASVAIEGTIYDMLMYPGDETTTTVILREGAVLAKGPNATVSNGAGGGGGGGGGVGSGIGSGGGGGGPISLIHLDIPGSSVTFGIKQPKDNVDDLELILPLPKTVQTSTGDTKPISDASP